MWILRKLVEAGNREHYFGNEGKNMEQQKFFTVNNKQYTVSLWYVYRGRKLSVYAYVKVFFPFTQ